jgi:hypothetical protein
VEGTSTLWFFVAGLVVVVMMYLLYGKTPLFGAAS